MSITLIESQPITFRSAFETDSLCNNINNKIYCQMYNQTDTLTAQWQQSPCGDNLSCWTAFDLCMGCDLSGINWDAGDWFLGTHWTQGSDKITVNSVGLSAAGNAEWTATTTLIQGHCYILNYTVVDRVGGSVQATLGGATGDLGSVSADGVYTELFICGATQKLIFDPSNSVNLSIQDIYLYDMGCLCAESDGPNSIDVSSQYIRHISGVSAVISGFTTLNVGSYYKATVTVENATAGYFTMNFYPSPEQFTGNGTFTVYAQSDSSAFTLGLSALFDGTITAVTVYEMANYDQWEVALYDLNGNYVAPINTFGGTNTNITLEDNYVTLTWNIADGDANGDPVADGCYQICLVDPCNTLYSDFTTGAVIDTNYFLDPAQWTQYAPLGKTPPSVANGILTFTSDSIGTYTATSSSTYEIPCILGCDYTVKVDFVSIDSRYLGTTITFSIGNVVPVTITQDIIDNLTLTFSTGAQPCDTPTLPISMEFESVSVLFGNPDALIEITQLTIAASQECYFGESTKICSNCISIKDSHDCTALLTAYCNEPSLGFNFTTFKLYQRLRTLFINPTSKNRNENYKFSDGTYYKNFAERDKVFDVLFDYVDEVAHDAIDTMLICDILKFQSTGIPNNDEYIWLDDSYKPEWDSQGRMNIAQSRIQLLKKSGALTNSNCS